MPCFANRLLRDVMPSYLAFLIMQYTLPISFATWVQSDARKRRFTPCYDFGMFVLMIWFIAVPWYLIWTRRWSGIPLTLMFFGLLMLPDIVAMVVWVLLYGR